MKLQIEYPDYIINALKQNVDPELYKTEGFEKWIQDYVHDSLFELLEEYDVQVD